MTSYSILHGEKVFTTNMKPRVRFSPTSTAKKFGETNNYLMTTFLVRILVYKLQNNATQSQVITIRSSTLKRLFFITFFHVHYPDELFPAKPYTAVLVFRMASAALRVTYFTFSNSGGNS